MEKHIISNTIAYSDGSESVTSYPHGANQNSIAEGIASDVDAALNPEKPKKERKARKASGKKEK